VSKCSRYTFLPNNPFLHQRGFFNNVQQFKKWISKYYPNYSRIQEVDLLGFRIKTTEIRRFDFLGLYGNIKTWSSRCWLRLLQSFRSAEGRYSVMCPSILWSITNPICHFLTTDFSVHHILESLRYTCQTFWHDDGR